MMCGGILSRCRPDANRRQHRHRQTILELSFIAREASNGQWDQQAKEQTLIFLGSVREHVAHRR